jgi:NhaP-type Na+/H+ or K+/H+ antiporter
MVEGLRALQVAAGRLLGMLRRQAFRWFQRSKRCRLAEHMIMTILPFGGRFLADVHIGANTES